MRDFRKFMNKGFQAFVPKHLVQCRGVVRIDKEITDEEIKENTKIQDKKLIEVKRINKRVTKNGEIEYVPTVWVLLTINGATLPRSATIY